MALRARSALRCAGLIAALACVATPAAAQVPAPPGDGSTPSASPQGPPVHAASLRRGVRAVAPTDAPPTVQTMIAAANRIARKPYVWGGGHVHWRSRGYDCSGSVSYILHAAGLLNAPLVSGQLAHWGIRGPGSWVTIYANGTHVWMTIAGLRFDNGGQVPPGRSHWFPTMRPTRGFKVRHIPGL